MSLILPSPDFYGRRQGRSLRVSSTRLMKELLPLITVDPENFIFNYPRLWLEIGFGSGEHLAYQAQHNADAHLIGVEVFRNGIANLLKQIDRLSLKNVSIFPGIVQSILPVLPLNCFEKLFILFPDPWPKARQRKRRLVNLDSCDSFIKLLKPGGAFYFASDHLDYCETVHDLIHKSSAFKSIEVLMTRPENWPLTAYNLKAEQKGQPCRFVIAHKNI